METENQGNFRESETPWKKPSMERKQRKLLKRKYVLFWTKKQAQRERVIKESGVNGPWKEPEKPLLLITRRNISGRTCSSWSRDAFIGKGHLLPLAKKQRQASPPQWESNPIEAFFLSESEIPFRDYIYTLFMLLFTQSDWPQSISLPTPESSDAL